MAEPTRRYMLAGALAVTAVAASGSSPLLAELGERLANRAAERKAATIAFRAARRRVARWGDAHPRPDYSGDGRALLAWLEACRTAIEESGASARHATYQRACAEHEHIARIVAVAPVRRVADVQALADMLEADCDGIVRAAMLAGLQAV